MGGAANETMLIDLPRGIAVPEFLKLVAATTGKPAKTLLLTFYQDGDWVIVKSVREWGITRVVTSPAIRTKLLAAPGALAPRRWKRSVIAPRSAMPRRRSNSCPWMMPRGTAVGSCIWPGSEFFSRGRWSFMGHAPASWHGHGPSGQTGYDNLRSSSPPTWFRQSGRGAAELLARQRRFLTELRRQVGYQIAQGKPHAGLADRICLPSDCLVWTPYGNPIAEDIEHVYAELTVPRAPFHGREPLRRTRAACAGIDRRSASRAGASRGRFAAGVRGHRSCSAFHGRRSSARPRTSRRSACW